MLKVLLIVVQGKPEGKTIPIATPVFRVGRGEDCHLRPNSEEVSRRHTEITISDTEVLVRDLGSRNGTRVNGKLLTGDHQLKSGELIQIGPLTFAVAIQGEAAAATPSQGQPPASAAGPKTAAPSLDDVPHDEIEAWLVSDNARPTPDRPSGVYDGDTLTIDAYREAAAQPKSSTSIPTAKPEPAPPAAKAEPKPAPVAEPKPEPVAESKPEPVVEPKPEPVAESKPAPVVESKPEPVAAAPAAEEEAEPEPDAHFAAALEGFEQLPEGTGDAPSAEASADEGDADDDENDDEEADEGEEELIDESNPFYVAKKSANTGAEPAASKAAYKDTSDAASDILRRMLDRRRSRS